MESAVILANPRSVGYMVGGAENQLIQLGVELCDRGKRVTLMGTVDHDASEEPFAYIQIKGSWSRPKGWLKLFQALREIKPDIFVTRVLDPLLPIYGILCKLLGIKLIYFCAHDWEIESRPDKRIQGWRWRLFWIGIHFTNKLFVQNNYQLEGFKRLLLWGNQKVLVNRNLPLMEPVKEVEPNEDYFTWIGSYRPHKRPEWVIELAEKLPHLKFEVVLDVKKKKDVEALFQTAQEQLPNFNFIPGVDRKGLSDVYKRAKVILITSEGEGFPNVAIEAWSQAKPVVSTMNNALVDLEDNAAVHIANSIDEMVELLSKVDPQKWNDHGQTGLKLTQDEFSRSGIINRFLANCD